MSVVGLSFRVPGATDLDTLHRVLGEERSLVSAMPPARYAADPGDYVKLLATERPGTFLGAWLDDVERFDAHHFGISPLEARRMDPQQRLSMEESWRALEDAGLPPRSLAGSRTGVFVGASNHDYVLSMSHDLHAADVFKVMGNALGMISNRVSHALDLRGPSFTIDTACSSSFVALHQAMQSLQTREIDLALVGGVNLITSPHLSVAFSRAHMLATDGRCKTFSDDADGYVRGEAVVFLVLMRTEDARREGRRSHIDLLSSALNQDGHTPTVTAPKLEAQVAVIQEALAHGGLTPSALSYVEAHGTGTPVGDPTEHAALVRVLKSAPREQPCLVGSVKTRMGHAEPASGMVGLLKVIASLKHDELHAHRNVRRFNPALTASPEWLEVPLEKRAWPRGEPRIAGVSSFGFGGTNAHVVVREALEQRGFVGHTLTNFGGKSHWKKPAQATSREEPARARPREVLEDLKKQLASVLLIPLEKVDADRPLLELGVDSLELFTLLQRVESRYGISVSLDRVLQPRFSLAQFAELVGTSEPRLPAPRPSGAFSMFAPRPPDEREAEPPSALERETIELLARRAPGSKAAAQRFRDVLADNRNTAGFRPRTKELTFPLVADRAYGSKLIDVDGNEWIDFSMGFGVHLFGHAPSFITSAVHEALQRGAPIGPQSPLAGEVARLLADLTGLERFTFTNSGTEAVMLACRLARAATRRDKIVVFEGAYHGTFDGLLGRVEGGPLTPGTTASMVSDLIVLPWNDPASLERLRSEGGAIAAVLVEPVQSRRPSVQPVEFLRSLREITRANGAALIFDEVITGFRCGTGGAQQRFGVKADLAVYGKVLGGGFPIGVVGGSARFLAGVDGGTWQYGDASAPSHSLVFFAGTFCKHPVAMAAAKAVLERLRSEGAELLAHLEQRTQRLAEFLNAQLHDAALPLEVHSFASLFRFHSSRNLDLFFARLNAAGFYAWEGRTLFLSEAHTDAELERFVEAVLEAARATLGEEGLRVSGPQRRFLELPAGSRAGNVAFALRLEGELDVTRFEAAIRHVLSRHDIFRAQFDREQGTVRFGGASRVELETVRLGPDERLEDRLERLAQLSFDASRGPLAQFTLFDCGERRWCLGLLAHGLLVDATSLSVLLGELAMLLKAPTQLPSAPSYRDAMTALARVPEQALSFWLEQHPSGLPAPRWPSGSAQARRLKHVIEPESARKIREAARAKSVTAFTWLFTAFSRALGPGAAIVVPIADRRFPGGERTVGNLTQLVAIPQPEESKDLLAHNASLLPRCYEHARLSLSELCSALKAKGLPHSTPQVLFNLEPALRFPVLTTENGGRITLEELDVPRPEARYAVSVNVLESDEGLRIDLDWLVDSLDEASARALLDRLVAEASR